MQRGGVVEHQFHIEVEQIDELKLRYSVGTAGGETAAAGSKVHWAPESLAQIYTNQVRHDPKNLGAARELAADESKLRLGVLYRDESNPRYEETRHLPLHTAEDKIRILNEELDKYAV